MTHVTKIIVKPPSHNSKGGAVKMMDRVGKPAYDGPHDAEEHEHAIDYHHILHKHALDSLSNVFGFSFSGPLLRDA